MPSITRQELVEHLTPPPGIQMPPYPRSRDRVYRWALAGVALGFYAEAAGDGLGHIFRMAAQGWTALALVVAGWTFLVWLRPWRYAVRAMVLAGLAFWPFDATLAWALSVGAAAIMAAKETHCFHFPAGKLIPWYALALGLAIVLGAPRLIQGAGWLGLAILWTWLVYGRWQLPLFEI